VTTIRIQGLKYSDAIVVLMEQVIGYPILDAVTTSQGPRYIGKVERMKIPVIQALFKHTTTSSSTENLRYESTSYTVNGAADRNHVPDQSDWIFPLCLLRSCRRGRRLRHPSLTFVWFQNHWCYGLYENSISSREFRRGMLIMYSRHSGGGVLLG
jgi:hypothetical protein